MTLPNSTTVRREMRTGLLRCLMGGLSVTGALAAVMLHGVHTAGLAQASNYGLELNGPYRVVSNGDWAKTNEVYMDEPTKVQTWTIDSTCSSPISCEGTVVSDEGWTAPVRFMGDFWLMRRDVENWVPCRDGTTAPGRQTMTFFAMDPATGDKLPVGNDLLIGIERTRGPSGACGVNKPVTIELPMRLEKLE
ncbi:hypothetical protein [Mycolicibacterium vanbaalenii]|nr:hypothetical protein [Mycolicibacterium vanbaalenii]